MDSLKISKIGDSLGIVLPEELLKQLNLSEGDRLFVTRTGEGIQLSDRDPEFEKAMKIYKKGSEKYKNALRELANK
ncbi:MAG: AbrB/MazE/SpoVT family DNA-binding domain-containing protein [Cyanobacteriota bacterium]|nr:AbrB/MazE/SpoVT family DNA-binding domain-containing protein [Cyanobacteriota bacterium]